MTFIVGGKYNNYPFLAVDSKILDHSEKLPKNKYEEKLRQFDSSMDKTYFCLMGQSMVKRLISLFDEYLKFNNELFDFTNSNDIKKLIKFLNYIKKEYHPSLEFGENILFFISTKEVRKYTFLKQENLYFNEIPQTTAINNNEILNSNSPICDNVRFNTDIKTQCKAIIDRESVGNDTDLRDRIAYLISNGEELEYTKPHKDFYDIVAMYLYFDFETLDKRKFINEL